MTLGGSNKLKESLMGNKEMRLSNLVKAPKRVTLVKKKNTNAENY